MVRWRSGGAFRCPNHIKLFVVQIISASGEVFTAVACGLIGPPIVNAVTVLVVRYMRSSAKLVFVRWLALKDCCLVG